MNTDKKLAFIGTGLMGLPMAGHLRSAGYDLNVYNRTAAKAQALVAQGCLLAGTVGQAVSDADAIISMLSDGQVLLHILQDSQMQKQLQAGAIWVDMSSTKPAEARSAAKILAERGLSFADAPVSGGTAGAQAATLAIMVGAETADFERIKKLLTHLGRPVRVGGIGSGQLAKLANQLIVASTIGAVAEATLLLEQGGADAQAVRLALRGGFADSTILQQHGNRMSTRDFNPGGLSHLQLKDLDNVLEVAAGLSLQLPQTQQVRARFARYVRDLGGAEKDHSGLFEELLDINQGSKCRAKCS